MPQIIIYHYRLKCYTFLVFLSCPLARLFWPYLYYLLNFLSQLIRNKSGQVGRAQEKTDFYQEKGSKAAIFTPNTGVLVQFFCPLLVFKTGLLPTFFGHFWGIAPKIFAIIVQNLILPTFVKNENGQFTSKFCRFSCQLVLFSPQF